MSLPDRTDLLKIADATVGAALCRLLGRLHFLMHGDAASTVKDHSSTRPASFQPHRTARQRRLALPGDDQALHEDAMR